MRWIYISPHLDDAVLSCGGMIYEQTCKNVNVEIWSICTGDPPEGQLSDYAEELHTIWETGREAVSYRRQEDIQACEIVSAKYRHLPFLDCIYRQGNNHEWLYPNKDSIFGSLNPLDKVSIETLFEFLSVLLRPDDRVVCPLGIGGHVDHNLTRLALERLDRKMHYYAEIPYLIDYPDTILEKTGCMRVEIYPLSDIGLEIWQQSISAYKSQIHLLFRTMERMQETIQRVKIDQGGTRLWSAN